MAAPGPWKYILDVMEIGNACLKFGLVVVMLFDLGNKLADRVTYCPILTVVSRHTNLNEMHYAAVPRWQTVVKCSRVFLQMGELLHARVTLVKRHVVSKKLEEARLMIIKPLLSAE